ncbi:hypothetical protein [Frisingicoccus sp.]|uniref:hypothetical protein n=1 Tax=Frisingicoccus sp. TaxID=1918627 RepID=UPI003AB13D0F
MGSELLKMADGFAMVAESIRAMAALQTHGTKSKDKKQEGNTATEKNSKVEKSEKTDAKTTTDSGKKEVTVEDIRAVLAQKSQDGKPKEIKELLGKFGAVKLSAVKSEDFPELFQEAKVL